MNRDISRGRRGEVVLSSGELNGTYPGRPEEGGGNAAQG